MKKGLLSIRRWGVWLIAAIVLCLTATAQAETDVTAKVQLVKSALGYDRLNKQSYLTVSVKNISADVLLTPVKVVVTSVTPATVTVVNADGVTADGKPYFEYKTATGQLLPSGSIAAKRWNFANPSAARFSYTTRVLGTIPEVAKVMTPDGGVVEVFDPASPLSGITIQIPALALNTNIIITISESKLNIPYPENSIPLSPIVELLPNGKFNDFVTVSIPINEDIGANRMLTVMYFDELSSEWKIIDNYYFDPVESKVVFVTNHFTNFVPVTLPIDYGSYILDFDMMDDSMSFRNDTNTLSCINKSVAGACNGISTFTRWHYLNKKKEGSKLRTLYDNIMAAELTSDLQNDITYSWNNFVRAINILRQIRIPGDISADKNKIITELKNNKPALVSLDDTHSVIAIGWDKS